MASEYNSICDDFYVNLRLGTQMTLPHQRETLLHFFEQIQKAFPEMTRFRRNDAGDYTLEEDRDKESYHWLSIEPSKIACGHVNPPSIEEALKLHRTVVEHAPYALGLSMVEIDHMDVLFGFDLEYAGNHDEIVAESLYRDSPLFGLFDERGTKAIDVQPTMTVALSEDCRLQARVDVVTRTSSYQVRTGEFSREMISVYLVIRRYWGDRIKQPMGDLLTMLAEKAEHLANKFVIPQVVRPIRTAIGTRS